MAVLERASSALSMNDTTAQRGGLQEGRVTCISCGYNVSGICGDYLESIKLWLSVDCCGKDLWALNIEPEHIDVLDANGQTIADGQLRQILKSAFPDEALLLYVFRQSGLGVLEFKSQSVLCNCFSVVFFPLFHRTALDSLSFLHC